MASIASVLPSSQELARHEIARHDIARKDVAAGIVPQPKPSLWRRMAAAMMAAQARRAERDVARYLAITGLKFTDSTEREIEQRFLSPNRFHRN